jgi:hydrogenase maturation protease
MARPHSVLVLGLGNPLCADDGFGVRAVEALRRRFRFPDEVTLMDGGTRGYALLPQVQAAEVLVVFDAVDAGAAPGSLVRVEGQAVPKRPGAARASLHEGGFDDVLALAEALGKSPAHRLLIGVQPVTVANFGAGLTPVVRRQLEPALGMALDYLERFAITPRRARAAGRVR